MGDHVGTQGAEHLARFDDREAMTEPLPVGLAKLSMAASLPVSLAKASYACAGPASTTVGGHVGTLASLRCAALA